MSTIILPWSARKARTKKPPTPNGAVIWRGPSLLDGAPLVVIAVGLKSKSTNSKTGGMLQTYILREDLDPVAAVRLGLDVSICGQCPARGKKTTVRQDVKKALEPGQARAMEGRTCYVNIGQGPSSVFRAFVRGRYPDVADIESVGRNRKVRLGTYGDPGAVPTVVWQRLLRDSLPGHTGYTHQWRTADEALKKLCMASADSVNDAQSAQGLGWRTFRVAMPGHALRLSNEASCPASAEAGRKLTCDTCGACGGADGRRGSIVIQAHGGFAIMAAVNREHGIRPYFARGV